jgi:hypothetical protein
MNPRSASAKSVVSAVEVVWSTGPTLPSIQPRGARTTRPAGRQQTSAAAGSVVLAHNRIFGEFDTDRPVTLHTAKTVR